MKANKNTTMTLLEVQDILKLLHDIIANDIVLMKGGSGLTNFTDLVAEDYDDLTERESKSLFSGSLHDTSQQDKFKNIVDNEREKMVQHALLDGELPLRSFNELEVFNKITQSLLALVSSDRRLIELNDFNYWWVVTDAIENVIEELNLQVVKVSDYDFIILKGEKYNDNKND